MNGGEAGEWARGIWGYIYIPENSWHTGLGVGLCDSMEIGVLHLVPRTTFPTFFMILVLRLTPGEPGSCDGTPA